VRVAGENPQIEVAAKAEAAIEKGFAGPGLLAFIVTSKFADYLHSIDWKIFRATRL